jgi:hypothetical protein
MRVIEFYGGVRRENQHERRNLHPHGFEFTQGLRTR